jgi:hypothetical protein
MYLFFSNKNLTKAIWLLCLCMSLCISALSFAEVSDEDLDALMQDEAPIENYGEQTVNTNGQNNALVETSFDIANATTQVHNLVQYLGVFNCIVQNQSAEQRDQLRGTINSMVEDPGRRLLLMIVDLGPKIVESQFKSFLPYQDPKSCAGAEEQVKGYILAIARELKDEKTRSTFARYMLLQTAQWAIPNSMKSEPKVQAFFVALERGNMNQVTDALQAMLAAHPT